MKKIIFVILLIIGGVFLAQRAAAQFSIGITPLSFELTANPGEVIENYFKVFNPSDDTSVQIEMIVQDIAPTGEAGHVIIEPAETETYSLARWVTTDPEEFNLAPKEEKFVKFTINVPENAEPGGHYGVVIAGAKVIAGPGAVGTAVIPRVGSLVLLTVPGEMIEALVVENFTAPRYSEYGPIPFKVRFENTGTVHVRPVALITIVDFFGKKVGEVQLPQNNVLPDAIRAFEVSWEKKWLFGGRYTATLSGTYGGENIPLSPVVITFWAFPWKVGIGILAFLGFLILTRKRWLMAFRVLIKGEKALKVS